MNIGFLEFRTCFSGAYDLQTVQTPVDYNPN